MTIRKSAKLYDSRVAERYVRTGEVSQEAWDKYMANLPDETPNAQWVQLDMHDAELGDSSSPSEGDEEAS